MKYLKINKINELSIGYEIKFNLEKWQNKINLTKKKHLTYNLFNIYFI